MTEISCRFYDAEQDICTYYSYTDQFPSQKCFGKHYHCYWYEKAKEVNNATYTLQGKN